MEMKQVLQRQPGPEVAEQLQIYQQSLKEKTKQMKVWKEGGEVGRMCNFHIYVVVVLQNGIVVPFLHTEHGIRVKHVRVTGGRVQDGH